MRHTIFALLVLAGMITSAVAQPMRKEALLEDLYSFRENLSAKHINAFTRISQQRMDELVQRIEARAGEMNQYEFLFALSAIMQEIGDMHSRVIMPYRTELPLRCRIFEDGVFVTALPAALWTNTLEKLVSINGHSIDSIKYRLQLVIQHENPYYFNNLLETALNDPSLLYAAGILPTPGAADIVLQSGDGSNRTIHLTATPVGNTSYTSFPALPAFRRWEYYWYQYYSDYNTMYVQYWRCSERKDSSFADVNRALFAAIGQLKPAKLVLDLRYNGGGNSAIFEPFLKDARKSYLNESGKLYVLIGKRTFSSALINAVQMKKQTRATLVGEPTGGDLNGYGEVRDFVLPNTKATVVYSTRYRETWKGKTGPLIPDISINYYSKSFMSGNDEALDWVFNH
jgi:hypothetical protein